MRIPYFLRVALFRINPRLAGATRHVITDDKKSAVMGDWNDLDPDTLRWLKGKSMSELMAIIDFNEEVLIFLNGCQPFKVTKWDNDANFENSGDYPLGGSKTIWFLDSADAVRFKLTFGNNE